MVKKFRQKPVNIYYAPNENAYYPPMITKDMIKGKKPKGWNLKNSTYIIKVKMTYYQMYHTEREATFVKFHHTTIKNVRFSSSNKLEVAFTTRLAEKIPEWETADIADLSRGLPESRYIMTANKKRRVEITRR